MLGGFIGLGDQIGYTLSPNRVERFNYRGHSFIYQLSVTQKRVRNCGLLEKKVRNIGKNKTIFFRKLNTSLLRQFVLPVIVVQYKKLLVRVT